MKTAARIVFLWRYFNTYVRDRLVILALRKKLVVRLVVLQRDFKVYRQGDGYTLIRKTSTVRKAGA